VGIKAILPITVNTLAQNCVIIKTNNMDQELVRHFVEECKRDQEWAERWASNHIEFDDYFKYSGKIEKTKEIVEHYISQDKHGMMLRKRPYVLKAKDPVVRHYFQNPDMTLIELGIHFDMCFKEVSNRITKYLKTRTDEKGDTIFA